MIFKPKHPVAVDMPARVVKALGIRDYEGYLVPFTRQQSPLAKFKNGSRVRKVKEDTPGSDEHPVGSLGTVLGSMGALGLSVAYYVEWDRTPHVPILCIEPKLEQA